MMNESSLTYAVVIATFNRHDILFQCVECVLAQDYQPLELVIVDATPNWEVMRDRIRAYLDEKGSNIVLHYVEAGVRSSAAQRNQGISLATADILFLIDDDSLMFPDCAREILAVYEMDKNKEVAGVQGVLADSPPTTGAPLPSQKKMGAGSWSPTGGLRYWLYRNVFMMSSELMFLPYWGFHKPSGFDLREAEVMPVRLVQGCRMTFRRDVIDAVRFEEALRYYAAGEDLDASYRASQRGLLLEALRARIYHHTVATGRVARGMATELSALNMAFLLRKNVGARKDQLLRLYLWLARRARAELLKDLLSRRVSVPQLRAILRATGSAWRLWVIRNTDLDGWYAALQTEIARRHASA